MASNTLPIHDPHPTDFRLAAKHAEAAEELAKKSGNHEVVQLAMALKLIADGLDELMGDVDEIKQTLSTES